jgi:glycosyltransferase involved in cell wall biosynthesis
MNSPDERRGISAVLLAGQAVDSAVLDLAAVLQGLVSGDFEIVVVSDGSPRVAEVLEGLRASAPRLPLRLVEGKTIAAGFGAAEHDLICVCAADGQFDIRELNHLLEAVEQGADLAIGYRPRWTDGIIRQLQRWGWQIELDCAFELFRRTIRRDLRRVRRLGYRVVQLPVSDHRPMLGTPAAAATHAA